MFVIFNPFAARATPGTSNQPVKTTPISSPYADGQKAKPTHTSTVKPQATPTKTVKPTPIPTKAVEPTPTPVPVVALVNWDNATSVKYTINAVNVRSTPYTDGAIVSTLEAGAEVTIYGSINGEAVSNSPIWYRISDQNSNPEYIYSGLLTTEKPAPAPAPANSNANCTGTEGQMVDVNLSAQWATFCNNGKVDNSFAITSGQPDLPTPTGIYHVFNKQSPTTFYSPWPVGSPYYYEPTHINYALEFKEGGFFLHDAWWRSTYGPGTNVPHTDPQFGEMTGTHGCVVMSTDQAGWLYGWAPMGTTVNIHY
ncbi:hypothetical protein KDA_68790 [Dictyobacter alpinus]|uniref:Uncharacterized protein n=2 Tax=Dictyobacter alpinus TaxID=2014873 RepID=A0A402BJ57_9CHLR|nr:hypothetical protein KDA_68790 [Dictyobacter alpinus]